MRVNFVPLHIRKTDKFIVTSGCNSNAAQLVRSLLSGAVLQSIPTLKQDKLSVTLLSSLIDPPQIPGNPQGQEARGSEVLPFNSLKSTVG